MLKHWLPGSSHEGTGDGRRYYSLFLEVAHLLDLGVSGVKYACYGGGLISLCPALILRYAMLMQQANNRWCIK